MKMKRFWKKVITHVLTIAMLASVFSTVDMGWNVREVQAANTYNASKIIGQSIKDVFLTNGDSIINDYEDSWDKVTLYFYDSDTQTNPSNSKELFKGNTYTYEDRCKIKVDSWTSLHQLHLYEQHIYSNPTCKTSYKCDCGKKTHAADAHDFTKQDTTYLKSDATCTSPAVYYKSCSKCGERGSSTFNYGDAPGHNFSYTVDDNQITAKCQNTEVSCPYNATGITLTLNASDKAYTGSAYTGASIGNWSTGGSTVVPGLEARPAASSIEYYKQGESTALSGAPIDVGSYTAKLTVKGVTATKDFKITKKDVAVDDLAVVTVTGEDAVYNGQPKPAQVSVASGKTGLGTVTVKYQKQNSTGWDEVTTDEPVNAGTYRVLASTTEGNNFNATSSDLTNNDWKFTISKKPIAINPKEGQSKTFGENDPVFTYDDFQNELVEETDKITGAMGREPGEDVINEGYAYTVDTLSAGDNYELTIPADAPKFVIHKLTSIDPPAPGEGYILDYDKEELKAEPATEFEIGKIGEGGEFIPISGPENLEPGDTEQTYYVRYKENENHPESGWTPITIAPRPAAPAQSPVVERTDVSITLQMIPGVEYSLNRTDWFIANGLDENVTVSGGKITFAGLNPDTDYTIHSRVKATNTAPHGHETEQTVKTKKSLSNDINEMYNFTPPEDGNPTYNKQPKEAGVEKKDPYQGIGDPIIKYYKIVDGEEVEVEKPTDAGEYTVTVSAPPTDDYPAVPETEIGRFTIAKKQITITPNSNQSKVYGTPDPVITYTVDPALCKEDKFIGALTYTGADQYANVKSDYPIEKGTLSAGNNYELTLTPGVTFEIKRATYDKGPDVGVGYTIDYVAETLTPASMDFEIGKKEVADINVVGSDPVALTDELSSTPLREIYYVRYKENTNQTISPWSAITIPARPAAPNAKDKQETIENKKDAEVTGVNSTMEYKFEGDADWTTVDGAKVTNPENKKITIRVKASNENKNFYGQEKTLVFTPSTTKLKVRIGDKIIEVPYGGTIPIDHKPQKPTPPNGQVFMHWAFGDEEWIFDDSDTDSDDADASKVTDNITLVPVWGIEIDGIITAQGYDSITEVSLVDGKGNRYNHHDTIVPLGEGKYKYSVIAPAGVDYNLVVLGKKTMTGDSASHDITKTQLINLKQGGNGDIVMPAGVFNSKVTKENAGDYEHTLVGGLDNIAEAHVEASDVVTVEMKVSAYVTNADEIASAIKNKTLDFVELTLTKTTNNGTATNIGSTNDQLLEIIIPYNTAGKYNISVYRYHGDKVETLIPAKNIDGEYIKVGADTVTIYAKKFSTYAIGYSTTPPSSGSNDHNKSQEDDSNNSGSTPSDTPLPKKDAPAEKKPSDGLPKLIAKNTSKKDGNKEITDKNLLVSNTTGDEKDNLEKSGDVKDDSVVENDTTQLEVVTSVPETEANKGSHRHHLLWLYLVLLAFFFVARAITKEKASTVKISLLAGDVVIAGLLLFVVKICLLSVIVCLAEIVVASVIHLLIRSKNQTANTN